MVRSDRSPRTTMRTRPRSPRSVSHMSTISEQHKYAVKRIEGGRRKEREQEEPRDRPVDSYSGLNVNSRRVHPPNLSRDDCTCPFMFGVKLASRTAESVRGRLRLRCFRRWEGSRPTAGCSHFPALPLSFGDVDFQGTSGVAHPRRSAAALAPITEI